MLKSHASQKLLPARATPLFRTASAEFAAHGFRQASLNRIIGAVGMSKSSFYHYFDSKADLFTQTLEHALAPFLAQADGFDFNSLNSGNFWPAVASMIEVMDQAAKQSPQLIDVGRMFYRSLETTEEQAMSGEIMSLSSDLLGRLIRRGQEVGQLRDDLPETLLLDMAMALGMAVDRWYLRHWEGMDDTARQTLNAQVIDLFRRLLGK